MRLLIVLLAVVPHAQSDPPFLPMETGTVWTYSGTVETSQVVRTRVTWKSEILDSARNGRFRVALLRGHPLDLLWYTPETQPGCYLLTSVDDREYYLQRIHSTCTLPQRGYQDLTIREHLILKLPARLHDRFGGEPGRDDSLYAWSVEEIRPVDLSRVPGVPQVHPLTGYVLAYRTMPDHQIATYVSGVGLSSYVYGHHGTHLAVDVQLSAYQQGTTGSAGLALPFYDWNVCPGESCVYGTWCARKPAVVYDTWKENRRRISEVAKGETVTALTGIVITFRPGVIRVYRDLPDRRLKAGDTILTYAYRGEGFSAAWVNGRYESDYDISFTKWPDGSGCGGDRCAATYVNLGRKAWWVQVTLKSGRTGWVHMDQADFGGSCTGD